MPRERYISPEKRHQIIDELISMNLIYNYMNRMQYQKIINLLEIQQINYPNLEQKTGLK